MDLGFLFGALEAERTLRIVIGNRRHVKTYHVMIAAETETHPRTSDKNS